MSDNLSIYLIGAVAAAVPLHFLIKRWAQGGQFHKNDVRIDGKVVIVTGANVGIGIDVTKFYYVLPINDHIPYNI